MLLQSPSWHFPLTGKNTVTKKEIMRQPKDGEVRNKEASLTALRLHHQLWWTAEMHSWAPAPPPDRFSITHFVFPTVPLERSSGPHLTRSEYSLFFFLFPDFIRKSLLSCHFLFLWHLLLNTSNHVKIGSHEKQARKEIRRFPLPSLPFILKLDLATSRNYVIAYRHTLKWGKTQRREKDEFLFMNQLATKCLYL